MRLTSLITLGLLSGLVTACGPGTSWTPGAAAPVVAQAASLKASFLAEGDVPADVRQASLASAQQTAGEASRRRQIDFFNVHPNPVGMRFTLGDQSAYVLSYLGTSRERTSLNIEMRALVASGSLGFTYNYSGPETLSRGVEHQLSTGRGAGLAFELIEGTPPESVVRAYETYMEQLGGYLQQRYQAKPFQFGDEALAFAILQGGEPRAFLFLDQGDKLVLGERKYADIQSVALFSVTAQRVSAYTMVGFNEKTPASNQAPTYQDAVAAHLGTVVQFGDL